MAKTAAFLSKEEEQEIVQAIVEAEKNTSGEVRVHIENHSNKTPLERAQEVFFELKMEATNDRNGVLFYLMRLNNILWWIYSNRLAILF